MNKMPLDGTTINNGDMGDRLESLLLYDAACKGGGQVAPTNPFPQHKRRKRTAIPRLPNDLTTLDFERKQSIPGEGLLFYASQIPPKYLVYGIGGAFLLYSAIQTFK